MTWTNHFTALLESLIGNRIEFALICLFWLLVTENDMFLEIRMDGIRSNRKLGGRLKVVHIKAACEYPCPAQTM
ncbi:unnamed protein product [Ixodes persulcatus]